MSKVHQIFQLGETHEVSMGASFAPSGWVAPFMAAHVYAVGWVALDLEQMFKDYNADLPTALTVEDAETGRPWIEVLACENGELYDEVRESRTEKFKYYYRDYEKALACARFLDAEEPAVTSGGRKFHRKPEHRFRLETTVTDTLSLTPDAKEKFENDVISWEVELKAPQKNSPNWFNWHGLMLPSIVSAYAQLVGWDVDEFNLEELTKPEDEVIVTDKFQEELIGNTDIGFEASKLWVRRKLLWSQLGEEDTKASNPDDTESDKLKAALKVATSDWKAPVFCRVLQVPSPKVDDVWEGSTGRVRSRIPVIVEFYPNQDAAQASVDAEREERGQETKGGSESESDGPDVPDAWASIPDDWRDTVKTLKDEIGKKPVPVIKKMLNDMADRLKDEYMVEPTDVLAWWNEV